MKTKKVRFAFTLTELLVCIGIIALLGAILLPVFTQARKQSQKTTCQSNLRQIGLALRQYVNENDETWPTDGAWGNRSFIKARLLGCPQAQEPLHEVNRLGVDGYAYSTALTTQQSGADGLNEDVGQRDKDITYPTTTVAVCDAAIGERITAGPNPYHFFAGHSPPNGVEKGWLRHNGGGNYLFCDGHVKWYLPDTVGYNETPSKEAGHAPTFALAENTP